MSAQLKAIAVGTNEARGLRPDEAIAAADRLSVLFAKRAESHDRAGSFSHRNIADLHEAGLLARNVPSRLGGGGASLSESRQILGRIAQGDPSTALVLGMQVVHHANLARSGGWPPHLAEHIQRSAVETGALLNVLRVEPELGSPARGGLPETIARRSPAGWSLAGRKIYSTGAPALSWGLVWARTDEAPARVGLFLVPMAARGLTIEESWDQLGMRASGSHDVVLDGVEVPLDHAVDLRAPAAWASPDPIYLAWNTTAIAAIYDGVARAAQAWFIGFLRARVPSNLGAPLATLPRFQEAIGESERLLAINERLLAGAAEAADRGEPLSPTESGLTKLSVTENAIQVVQRAIELTGNPGLSRANPLERHLRDVLCARIHTPQGDSVRLAAGRMALGL
jgi:alkylation response protein AidB-like acyl-CoA dehydrogenase